jgi:hypothetical protein
LQAGRGLLGASADWFTVSSSMPISSTRFRLVSPPAWPLATLRACCSTSRSGAAICRCSQSEASTSSTASAPIRTQA